MSGPAAWRAQPLGILAAAALTAAAASGHATQRGPLPPCRVVAPEAAAGLPQVLAAARAFDARGAAGTLDRSAVRGNVTDIVRINNQTGCKVRISKSDPKLFQPGDEAIEVGPREHAVGKSMWVPWVESRGRDARKPITVYIDQRPYFVVWQRAGKLYFMTWRSWMLEEGFRTFDTATEAPGLALEGGRRVLHVATTPDGQPFIKIEGVRD